MKPVIGQGVHFNFNGRTIAALIIDILGEFVHLQTFDPQDDAPQRIMAMQGAKHGEWNYRPVPPVVDTAKVANPLSTPIK